jgi:hypothetical protein
MNNEYRDELLVGYLDFQFIEEAFIDDLNIDKYGFTKIYVYGNEGPIPHFHIVSENKNDICICICEAKYFNHGKYKNTFKSKKQLKMLDYWMDNININDDTKTNWEFIIIMWKSANPEWRNYDIKFPNKRPDYTKTINFK